MSRVTLRSVSTLSLYSEYDELGSKNDFDVGSVESLKVFETSSKGTVDGSLMWKYFKCGGNPFELFVIFILFILAQTVTSAADHWISFWTGQEEARVIRAHQNINTTESTHVSSMYLMDTDMCIYVFAAMLFSIFVIAMTR